MDNDYSFRVCQLDHSNQLKGYCTHCKLFYCENCSSSHLDHLEKVVSAGNQFQNCLFKYSNLNSQMDVFYNNFDSYDRLKNDIVQRIEKTFDEVIHKINSLKNEFIKYHLGKINESQEKFVHNLDLLFTLKQTVNEIILQSQQFLSQGKYKELISFMMDKQYSQFHNDFEMIRSQNANSMIKEKIHLMKRFKIESNVNLSLINQLFNISLSEEDNLDELEKNNEESFIYFFKEQTSTGIIYYPIKKRFKEIVLKATLPNHFSTTQLQLIIYLNGGSENGVVIPNSFLFNHTTNSFQKKADMNIARRSHGITGIGNYLYVAGGFNEGTLNSCEKYSILNDSWEQISSLNEKKCSLNLSPTSQKYLYATGGILGIYSLKKAQYIEKLNVTRSNAHWKTLTLKTTNCKINRFSHGSIFISPTKLLIFGGMKNILFSKADAMILDIENYSLTKCIQLPKGSHFKRSIGKIIGNNLYIFGSNLSVYMFDIPKQEWKMINNENIISESEEKELAYSLIQ